MATSLSPLDGLPLALKTVVGPEGEGVGLAVGLGLCLDVHCVWCVFCVATGLWGLSVAEASPAGCLRTMARVLPFSASAMSTACALCLLCLPKGFSANASPLHHFFIQ